MPVISSKSNLSFDDRVKGNVATGSGGASGNLREWRSGYVPQPFIAFVWMELRGEHITLQNSDIGNAAGVPLLGGGGGTYSPVHLQGFTLERNAQNVATEGTITLFDPNWVFLEPKLRDAIGADKGLKFQYGYVNGVKSPQYYASVEEVDTKFVIDGVQLTVKFISRGWTQGASVEKSRNFKKGTRISDIVKQIADDNGWAYLTKDGDLTIEPTKSILGKEDFLGTKDKEKKFVQTRQSDIAFIKNKLMKKAVSWRTKKGGYRLWFDDSLEYSDKPIIYFRPQNESGPVLKTYYYLRDRFSSVISFEPSIKGKSRIALGEGIVGVPYQDAFTKKWGIAAVNKSTHEGMKDGSQGFTMNPFETFKESSPSLFKFLPFSVPGLNALLGRTQPVGEKDERMTVTAKFLRRVANSLQEAKIQAETKAYGIYKDTFEASLQIIGDPRIFLDNKIVVITTIPDGTPHFSSGSYIVQKVTDDIGPGTFTTTMELKTMTLGQGSAKT